MRPLPVFLAVALLTALASIPLQTLRFDNTPESWVPANSPGLRALESFRQRFGDGSFVLAYATGPDLAQSPESFKKLAEGLRALPGIAAVFPPPFVEEESDGPRAPITAYLASEDNRHAAYLILLAPGSNQVETLEAFFAKVPVPRFRLAGTAVITHDLDDGSRQSLSTIGPLVALVLCLFLYFTTKEWRAVAAALVVIVVSSIWSLGLLAFFQLPLNLVVVILPAILAVVSITQAMHTLSRFHCFPADLPPAEAWPRALASVFRPSLFCAITTVAGFLSLATSSIPPVQHLGYFSAAGVAFSFVLCFTLFPALLSLSKRVRPRGVEAQVLWSPARAEALAAWLQRRRIAILAFALVAFAFSIYGVYRIRVESHTLDFFPPSHRVPSNYFAIEKNLLGLTPIDIVVSGPREVLLSNAALNSYKQFFTRTLEQEPLARQVVSILLEPSRTPKLEFVLTPDELREAFATEDLPAAAKNFLRVDGDQLTLRTTVLTSTASSNEVFALINRLRARLAAEKLSPKVSAELTGLTPLLIEGQVRLLETQIQSFALAFAVIAVAVFFAFRSLSATLLVLLPNLLPITITLGYMGWAGIPLNTATVTVAGIALGLIVDDSIHFIHHFKHLPSGLPAGEAVAETLLHLARPIAITSLAVAGSFALFSLSPFLPTAYFGRLIAITATAALFGVLVFLPALLLVQNRRR